MRKIISVLLVFTSALLLCSCNSDEHTYQLHIDDAAKVFSANDVNKFKAVQVLEGYNIAIVSVDEVIENNIYKHTREVYDHVDDNTKYGDNTIAIVCFKNQGIITTKMAPSLQNIIDTEYLQQYYQCQKVDNISDFGKQTAQILDMVNNATVKHNDLSFFKKSAISNGILHAFDFVLRYTIPQDSWVYKCVFHIPMFITLYITQAVGSTSHWVLFIFIVILFLFREYVVRRFTKKSRTSAQTLISSFIYIIFKLLTILVIFCMYTISIPRQELLWAMQEYGISEAFITSLQGNLTDVTLTNFGWFGCTLVCLFLLLCKLANAPEYIIYSYYKPEYQQRIYQKNKENIKTQIMVDKTAQTISQGYSENDSIDIDKLDNDEKPYVTLVTDHYSKSLLALLYLIPICIFFNSGMLMFYALYKSISLLENLSEIINELRESKKYNLL